MNKIKFFDGSLRDGLQSLKKIYTLAEKKDLLHKIINKYNPHSIEIGSIVSSKVLPQMHNSIDLFKHANKQGIPNLYMLTPNLKSVNTGLEYGVKNFSLITSVSDDFQRKNINKSLDDTKKELSNICSLLDDNNVENIKLYISCINECPISGKKELYQILDEINYYIDNYKNLNEICLSDTCGTLSFYDFKNIIDLLTKYHDFSLLDKISLHLHKNTDIETTKKILNYASLTGIYRFDVSCLENAGGCSVTIENSKLNNNFHYDDYKKLL
jgi:hydroxymethylglutaryl-CoA lyase